MAARPLMISALGRQKEYFFCRSGGRQRGLEEVGKVKGLGHEVWQGEGLGRSVWGGGEDEKWNRGRRRMRGEGSRTVNVWGGKDRDHHHQMDVAVGAQERISFL